MKGKYGGHLSKELMKRYGKRSIGVRKGDKVTVTKGKFKGKSGTVERVNRKKGRIMIDKVKVKKADGSERFVPVAIPNIVITELELSDQHRKSALERKGKKVERKSEEGG